MQKIFLLTTLSFFLFSKPSSAQKYDPMAAMAYTYYDSLTQKKVKEIYKYRQVIKMMPDKKHYGEYTDTTFYYKDGPYTFYFENGEVQITGFYAYEKKDSIWRYYDTKGKIIRTEKFRNGQLVPTKK